MEKVGNLLQYFKDFRLYSNSYVFLSIGAVIFIIWQLTLKLLVSHNPNIVNNVFIIIIAYIVFFFGLSIIVKTCIDFIKICKGKVSKSHLNKPIWLFDSILILYVIISNFI